jgi:uncharacterized protein
MIQACVKLYQASFNEHWLALARTLTEQTIRQFHDQNDGYFHYTSVDSEKLITSRKEIFDNVIPSSNSIMASNLFRLGILIENEDWKLMATEMVSSLSHLIKGEPNYMSNWAIAFSEIKKEMTEVVFTGSGALNLKNEFEKHFHPFALIMGSEKESSLPLIKDKVTEADTIFVCYNKTCSLPVGTATEALSQLK